MPCESDLAFLIREYSVLVGIKKQRASHMRFVQLVLKYLASNYHRLMEYWFE